MAHFKSPIISLCFFLLFAGTCTLVKAQNTTITNYAREGVFDTLYTSVVTFKNLSNHKLVLQYYFHNRRFNLHGWTAEGVWGRKFDKEPQLRLERGNAGGILFDHNKYFGDLVLDSKQIKRVKGLLSRHPTAFVLFVPILLDTVVNYEIMLTSDPNWLKPTSVTINGTISPPPPRSASTTSNSLIATDVIANPSPPRNFKKL